ncbi:MAG: sulfatase [Acidobacteriota bacterium]
MYRRYLLAIGITLSAIALAHCRPGGTRLAWHRFELWSLPPQIEIRAFPGRNHPLSRPVVSFLGAEEVRNLELVPAKQLEAFPKRPAGQVNALKQTLGSRLKWSLQLGEQPYLSLTPLSCSRPCTLRAGVRAASGEITELFHQPSGPASVFAPAAAELDLARWRNQEVDLLMQVDGEVPADATPALWPYALWGSPTVYTRIKSHRFTEEAKSDPGKPPPNILLLGIDTLRADAIGPRPGKVSLTPSIDRLASISDVYPDAFTALNVTNPSFASILTGLYGKNHGVYDLLTPLAPAQVTLAQLLAARGYDTFAVISARHLGDHNSGLGRGFGTVVEASEHLSAEMATGAAWDWLEKAHAPFFAWVHLFDPHTPHTPPQPYASGQRPATASGAGRVLGWSPFRELGPRAFDEPVLGGQRDLYDGEVAYLDREVGRLLDAMDSHGMLENTIIVLVADHGENLGEHGILYRHVGLWDTTTHVPMIVHWPGGRAPGVRRGLVQSIDLFPTLLAAVGIAAPQNDGTALSELVGENRHGRRVVFSEHSGATGAMVRSERYKYMTSAGNPMIPDGEYLYDLQADPGESQNLVGKGMAEEKELSTVLGLWLRDRRAPAHGASPQPLSEDDRARLHALGYL